MYSLGPIVGSNAYVLDRTSKTLEVVDVSTPTSPTRLGSIALSGYDGAPGGLPMYVTNNVAYIGIGSHLHVVDVSNPSNLVDLASHVIGTRPTSVVFSTGDYSIHDVQVVGNRAYVAAGKFGLHIVDVSNPAAPVLLGSFADDPAREGSSRLIRAVRVVGNQAYVLGESALLVVDVSNPNAPIQTTRYGQRFYTGGFELFDNRLYMSDGLGLDVRELTDQGTGRDYNPYYNVYGAGGIPGFAMDGQSVYAAVAETGLQALAIHTKISQGLNFTLPPLRHRNSSPVPLDATSNSEIPVNYNVVSGPATVVGNQLILTGPGEVTVRAAASGNGQFHPAEVIARTFVVQDEPIIRTIPENLLHEVVSLPDDMRAKVRVDSFNGPSGMSLFPRGYYDVNKGENAVAFDLPNGVLWTPTELQGPSTNVITIRFSADNQICCDTFVLEQKYIIVVTEVNSAPTLEFIGDRTLTEGSELHINLAGEGLLANFNFAVDTYVGSGPFTQHRYSAFGGGNHYYASTNQFGDQVALGEGAGQVIASMSFEYYANYDEVSGMKFRLYANDGPGGLPGTELDARLLDVRQGGSIATVRFDYNPANILPRIFTYTVEFPGAGGERSAGLIVGGDAPTAGSSQNEFWEKSGSVWSLKTLTAPENTGFGTRDVDLPVQNLTYRLVSGPAGMTVTASGRLTWKPGEVDAPSTNTVTVAVSDGEVETETRFTVRVAEVNLPPTFPTIADQSVPEGSVWRLKLAGSDSDLPPQALSYRVYAGPEGMAVTPSGELTWTPVPEQSSSAHRVLITLSDGEFTVDQSFTIVVIPLERAVQLAGKAVDGYLSGSLVFFDANLDGVRNSEEPSNLTDRQGNFILRVDLARFDTNGSGVLEPDEGRLVLSGGIDLATGAELVGTLTAPAGSTVVTPLTTMVEALMRSDARPSVAEAEMAVRQALSLPLVDLTSFDPLSAAQAGDIRAVAVQSAAAQVADTVRQISAVLGAAEVGSDAVAALAGALGSGTAVDLTEAATVARLLDEVAQSRGTELSSTVHAAVAEVVAAGNALKASVVDSVTDPVAAISTIARAQTVAQGPATEALNDLGAGRIGADDVLLRLTGDTLAASAGAAPLGDLFGVLMQSGTFELLEDTAVALESGRSLKPLTVIRRNGAAGAVRVAVRFAPSPSVKQNLLVLDFADGVIRQVADLGMVLADDTAPGTGLDLAVTLELAADAPATALLGTRTAASVHVVDDDSAGTIGIETAALTVLEDGAGTVPVVLERQGGSAGKIAVRLKVVGGTATEGEDYTASPMIAEFAPGELRKRVFLPLIDDLVPESDETVQLGLELLSGSATGSALIENAATISVRIADNDRRPTVRLLVNEQGQLQLLIRDVLGSTYRLQSSRDAAHWDNAIEELSIGADTTLEIDETSSVNAARFWRLVP